MVTTAAAVIAIVDDDNSVRESLQGLLRSMGYKVKVFASAEEYLNSEQLHETDCLILDVRMPGMTGLELQRRLRAQSVSTPIIFITAHGEERIRAQALGEGASAFLVKPLTEEMILGALNTVLGF
jgi:FixJ family two-component response regulator